MTTSGHEDLRRSRAELEVVTACDHLPVVRAYLSAAYTGLMSTGTAFRRPMASHRACVGLP